MADPKSFELELLRNRLRPADYISTIEDAIDELRLHWRTLNKNQVDGLRALIQANGTLLDKSLPDLRAMEITPEKEAPVVFNFAAFEPKKDAEDA